MIVPKPWTVGACSGSGASMMSSIGLSFCGGVDSRGWGVWFAGSSTEGLQEGFGGSIQGLYSNGDIRDQAGKFDTFEAGGGAVAYSRSTGTNVEGDADVATTTFGWGTGRGGGYGGGTQNSNTILLFHHDNC